MSPRREIRCIGIVNRGEAALRCVRAVRSLRSEERSELRAAALFTALERGEPFVRHADLAVELDARVRGVAAYLDHDAVIDALRRAGADAVWPGWGFVAEDPAFVDRVEAEGLVFLGPTGDTMRRLGDKIAAKQLAESLGVPVAAWSGEAVVHPDAATKHAERIGFPLVIKAAAGGGGRGIRRVDAADELFAAYRSATAEARAAFGDDRVFLERRIERGRHIEVQIAADGRGDVRSFGARDCSVQRRHQKLIEEAPPPGLDARLLARLDEAALALVRSVAYRGVGTVEFLVSDDGIFFLEVNPRLQVEHGVTEEVTGVDLVRLQIAIGRGEALPATETIVRGVAIEVRLCAEDPDAGFLPAPGRIVRFDAPFGPGVRVESGAVAGGVVPPEFDSLLAKVIARGSTRAEAIARVAGALREFEVVIAGGATNRGFLLDVLDSREFRAGCVDTGFVDTRAQLPPERRPNANEALAAAAILAYQRQRERARAGFFANPGMLSLASVPPSDGQEIDLSHAGESYPLQVFAVGGWRYRVHLGAALVAARLVEERPHAARLAIGDREWRVLHDVREDSIRVEIEGHAHTFGLFGAGQVRAGTPALVVSVAAPEGSIVVAGDRLVVLEAMKSEISVLAPVSGSVREVRVRRGQQVAAGDLLLVIEPERDDARPRRPRLRLVATADPLASLIEGEAAARSRDGFRTAASAPAAERRALVEAAREEIRRVLLGYDVDADRGERLVSMLEAPLPPRCDDGFVRELAEMRRELTLFADIEQLFVRTAPIRASGEPEPSNLARLRAYLRRMRQQGDGIAKSFMLTLRTAVAHYGIVDLAPSDPLERALLRLLASQRTRALRHRLVEGLLRCLTALGRGGLDLSMDTQLAAALKCIAELRGLVSDAAVDAAIEARYVLFEAASTPRVPALVLADGAPNERHGVLAARLRRLYAETRRFELEPQNSTNGDVFRVKLDDGRSVLAAVAGPATALDVAESLLTAARKDGASIVDLFVSEADDAQAAAIVQALEARLRARPIQGPLTLTFCGRGMRDAHRVFASAGSEPVPAALVGVHPETLRRLDLARLGRFALERLDGPEGIHAFFARSSDVPGDDRLLVYAEVCGRGMEEVRDPQLPLAAFKHAFHAATRTMRLARGERDPHRRLHWNRITVAVAPPIEVGAAMVESLARQLHPATRHLGLEKVIVRLQMIDPAAPDAMPRAAEIVIMDPEGSRMDIRWRVPRSEPLQPATEVDRRVAEARRRRVVYPYEVVRMLESPTSGLPQSRFEEFALADGAEPARAVSVAGRPAGCNSSGIVFGVVTTPTDLVPEGIRRVLVLSDPTREMGALGPAECECIVAAIDLAERMRVPVEWVPVSSGARIAMDSGTENLDATARVARRIVEFTDGGGTIHVLVHGVNVGAQSYWNALATMGLQSRGALVMTPNGAMVLTGRAALEASGGVAAEDELGIGGHERIMGPNGEAQYWARDLREAFSLLYTHYRTSYVVPGERWPRRTQTTDPIDRSICETPYPRDEPERFSTVGEFFDATSNGERKRPFAMRALMGAVIDQDGGSLERWRAFAGAETAIVWDARLGGHAVTLLGIESRSLPREDYRALDGPAAWNGGTLFPLSSKKVARALNAASGIRPVVVLANLSGFDGSPESMRRLQLEYGAEIARAVVRFDGPILFVVVSRYHGGAYVVFSSALNDRLHAAAIEGSYASVIGGGPAATVVFAREVRARALADPRLEALRADAASERGRVRFEQALASLLIEKQNDIAAEFDAHHTVERALGVGSLATILPARELRPRLVSWLDTAVRG